MKLDNRGCLKTGYLILPEPSRCLCLRKWGAGLARVTLGIFYFFYFKNFGLKIGFNNLANRILGY